MNGSSDYLDFTVYTANTTSQTINSSGNGTYFEAALHSYGLQGYTGSQGNIGYTGSASTVIGYTGSSGYTGSKGDIGYTGSQGITGYTGSNFNGYLTTNWSVRESSGTLIFSYSGADKMKIDSSGNLTVIGNVTGYGTI